MMKRTILFCTSLVALALPASAAAAADLSPGYAPVARAPVYYSPYYNWTGFYLGINGGGGWGDSHWQGVGHFGMSGGQVGGTAGYNWQIGQAVVGLEGDVDYNHLQGTTVSPLCPGVSCSTSDSWLSTVRGRVGYAFDRVMPYVTGGLAVGDIRAATPGFTGGNAVNPGWTVGGGVEFALPGNWTAKAEYLHVGLGHFDCTGCTALPPDNVSMQQDVFRAGVNYHFGWAK
jgi:outer membrane immunogenic protein